MIKRLFKFVIWPVKKIVLLPFKFLLYTLLIFVILILFFQYRADYQVDTSPLSKIEYENCIEVIDSYEITLNLLSEYVEELDSVQREFLEERLPDNLQVLLEPQKIDPAIFAPTWSPQNYFRTTRTNPKPLQNRRAQPA